MPTINNIAAALYKSYGWESKTKAEGVPTDEESVSENADREYSAAYKTELSFDGKERQEAKAAERETAQELDHGKNPLEGLGDPSAADKTQEDLIKMKKSYIEMLMKSVRIMSPRDYTGKSWGALLDCMEKAMAILGKSDATADELNEAEQLMHRGLAGLRRVEVRKKEESNSYKEIPMDRIAAEESEGAVTGNNITDAAALAGALATPSSNPVAAFSNAQGAVVTSINMKI